jgi:DNA polymerase-3 subunit gamma/tau
VAVSYLSLYRRWRPSTFGDVLGQAHVTETLTGAIREDRLSHAYLFSGPRGTGKTSTARILAKALNCEKGVSPTPCGECSRCKEIADGTSLDVLELDAASHTSVDDVREIREHIPYATAGGGRKVYIIDEAHQLSNPAFNALLKMLEEPPAHVIFVLCTTEPHRLPATVVSRCQRFEFRRFPGSLIIEQLATIAKAEKIETDDTALTLISRHARGSSRDALSLLDQAAGTAQGKVTREVVLEILGEAPEDILLDLAEAIGSEDILAVFGKVEELVNLGWDPRQLLVQLLEEFRALFLAHRGVEETEEVDPEHAQRRLALARRFTSAHLEWVLQALADAQADMRLSTHPRLTLEVALARAANLEVRETQTVVARLERLERTLLHGATTSPVPTAGSHESGGEPGGAPTSTAKPTAARQTKREASGPPDQKSKPSQTSSSKPSQKAKPPIKAVDGSLAEQWAAFLEAVRSQSVVTHTHLRDAWPIELDDDRLVVGFEKNFHAEQLTNRPDHITRINTVLSGVLGRKVHMQAEVRPGEHPGKEAPAENGGGAPSAVDLVREGLGAEVVEEAQKT